MPSPNELTEQQKRFCVAYVASFNATQAYLEAGYRCTTKSAEACASRLLSTGKVKAYLEELRRPLVESKKITLEELLGSLADIIRTPVGAIGPDSPICQEYVEEITGEGEPRGKLKRGNADRGNEVSTLPRRVRRVKMPDKLRAIDMAAKLLGLYAPEKIEVETGPITLETIKSIAERVRIVSPLLLDRLKSAGKPKA